MNSIFTLNDMNDAAEKINMDDLYERKKQHDLNTLNIYNRLLLRIHNKIKLTSRQLTNNQFCWFIVPEVMIGIPKYDHGNCTAYIIDKLQDNGFVVKYTHPNLLFISWNHWIPGYVRNEYKKKTGIIIDGYGNTIDEQSKHTPQTPQDANSLMLHKNGKMEIKKSNATANNDYKDVNSYKPTGGLIYNKDILKKLEDKFS
jgi:hypothetical protein